MTAGILQICGDQIFRNVTKLGAGKLEIVGNSRFLGTTVLQAGTVVINKGLGTILGRVSIEMQGYLTPGNSVGTLPLGTLSQFAPGSFYEAEYLVSGGSVSSDLLLAQAATGGSGLALRAGGYVLPQAMARLTDFSPDSFSIMSSTAGVSGHFASVRQTSAIGASLVYLDVSVSDSSLVNGSVMRGPA